MFHKFNELDSTNKYCLENYESLNDLDVVYALKQTAGRGRLGRIWESNDSVAMSIILKKELNYDLGLISFVAAASIYNVLIKYVSSLSIKWPNDLLINHQKVCGILCQSKIDSEGAKCLVIGIGINTNNEVFIDELKNKATSLYLINKVKYNNKTLIEEVFNEFIKMYEKFLNGNNEYLLICKENNYLINKEIEFEYHNKLQNGVVIGINDNCELLVKKEKEVLELKTGEVLLKKSYFY